MQQHPQEGASCSVCPTHWTILTGFSLIQRIQLWLKTDAAVYAPLLLRILLAYEFFDAGLSKWSGENWFDDLTFPFPFNLLPTQVNWLLAMGLELVAPVALVLGLSVRFFSAALLMLTWVAILAVHWPAQWQTWAELWRGYAVTDQGYGNFKLPLMYAMMLLSLLLSGAGRLSLDSWLTEKRSDE